MAGKRLTELDSLRGIAALAVVLYHFFYQYAEVYGHNSVLSVSWAYWGKFGVHLFFMISGFVIFWTLQRCAHPLDFLVSRFSRLYPVYWAAAGVTFLVVTLVGLPGREIDSLSAIANLTMIHEYFRVPHIDGVYWTLTVELTFYGWMFLLFVTNQLRNIELWLVGGIMLSASHAAGLIVVPGLLTKLMLLEHIGLFAAGVCFFRIWSRQHSVLTFAVLALSFTPNILLHPGWDLLVFAVHYLVFALLVLGFLAPMRWKALAYLGTISYALYLVHQNVGYVVMRELGERGVTTIPAILVAMLAALLIAVALTHLVEVPARRALRAAYEKSRRLPRLAALLTPSYLRKSAR